MEVNDSEKCHLPYPSGPFATGCIDLMTEYSPEGCFARIFYPTDIPSEQINEYSDKWMPWMPNETYLRGFASSLRIPFFVFKYGPYLIRQKPHYIPTICDAPLSKALESYPLLVFSHGFAATRFVCSEYCNSIASHGFIVVAIEHRDTSAPATFYYDSPESVKNDQCTWVDHVHLHQICDNDHYLLRNKQLKYRFKEMEKLLDTLSEINNGAPVENIINYSFDLEQFKGKLNFNKVIVAGYSFGGSTAMYTAANDKRIKTAVIIDGWMFPIKSEPFLNIDQPILFINSQTFHIPSNISVLRKYFNSKGIRQLYTLKNTTHESHTDTPYIWGYWLDIIMWKKLDPETALKIQSYLTIRFLRDHAGYPTNADSAQIYLKEHSDDITDDFISYTKTIKRKMGIFW
ncbi:platelet-activating factor acetylhydrolase-like [Adelges cooleyi]|uniref:platelet-activating factor acetylhydrolase-like n=1 Tax=Adelges cooleyi TaxID=133065 RepID=UPI00217F47D4|nr:platelet-activating factor acetylhydrolase-like [Adelges cooleyi]